MLSNFQFKKRCLVIRYSVQLKDQIFAKGYGLLSFAKDINKNIGKNINENLSRK